MPIYLCRPGSDSDDEPWRHVVQVYAAPFPMDGGGGPPPPPITAPSPVLEDHVVGGSGRTVRFSSMAAAAAAAAAHRSAAGAGGTNRDSSTSASQALPNAMMTSTFRGGAFGADVLTEDATADDGGASAAVTRRRRVIGPTTTFSGSSNDHPHPPSSSSSSGSNYDPRNDGITLRRVRHSEVLLADGVSVHHGRYWLRLRFPGDHGGFAGYVALGRVAEAIAQAEVTAVVGVGDAAASQDPLVLDSLRSSSGTTGLTRSDFSGNLNFPAASGSGTTNAAGNAGGVPEKRVISNEHGSPSSPSNNNNTSSSTSHSGGYTLWNMIESATVKFVSADGGGEDDGGMGSHRMISGNDGGVRRGTGGFAPEEEEDAPFVREYLPEILPDVLAAIRQAQANGDDVPDATSRCKAYWRARTGLSRRDFRILWSRVKEESLEDIMGVRGTGRRRSGAAAQDPNPSSSALPALLCLETDLVFPTSGDMTLLPYYDDGLKLGGDRREDEDIICDHVDATDDEYGADDDDEEEEEVGEKTTSSSFFDETDVDATTGATMGRSKGGEHTEEEEVFEGSDVASEDVDSNKDDGDATRSSSILGSSSAAARQAHHEMGKEPVFCRICREGLHDVEYDPPTTAADAEVTAAGGRGGNNGGGVGREVSDTSNASGRGRERGRGGSHATRRWDSVDSASGVENDAGDDSDYVHVGGENDDRGRGEGDGDFAPPNSVAKGTPPALTPQEVSKLKLVSSTHPSVENPLMSPCECSGSMAFVHYLCVEQWRCRSRHPAARLGTHCETCGARYALPPPLPRATTDGAGRQVHPNALLERIGGDGGGGGGEDWIEAMPPHVLAALRRPHFWWQVGVAIVRRRYLRPLAPILVSPLVALYCRARRVLKKRGVSRRRWSCSLCRRRARWKCVRCLRSYYCSRQCQNVSWHILHKHVCYKPSRFWGSVVVYGLIVLAACPGICTDPLPYVVGFGGVVPASFVVAGVLGGGVASVVKHAAGVDVRGRYLELLVVQATAAIAYVSWGLVWGFFGRPDRCMGIMAGYTTVDTPSGTLEDDGVNKQLSLAGVVRASHAATQGALRTVLFRPASFALHLVDGTVLLSTVGSKWICSRESVDYSLLSSPPTVSSASSTGGGRGGNASSGHWMPPFASILGRAFRLSEDVVTGAGNLDHAKSSSHVEDTKGLPPTTSVDAAPMCFAKLQSVNPDFLSVPGGEDCAADARFLTPIWLLAGFVVMFGFVFKRRDNNNHNNRRAGRFAARMRGFGGVAAGGAGGQRRMIFRRAQQQQPHEHQD